MRLIGARRGSGARLFDQSQLLRNGRLLKDQGIMSASVASIPLYDIRFTLT